MRNLKGQSAVVVGASSGVGRATLLALAAQGVRVCGVARTKERLERVVREAPGEVTAMVDDATRPEVATRLVQEKDPDIVAICLGAHAFVGTLDQHTWDTFSAIWNSDVKATFHLCQEAIRRPLKPGSVVIIVSSGAAIGGSPLSGGYAGAKRMQWLMAGYLQQISDKKKLGIRFVALVPKQLIAGTETGERVSSAYAAEAGISQEKFMERFGAPLLAEGVADAIAKIARGEVGPDGGAFAVTGKGIEAL
jgi:NAD(P)-dependent dehydrogenase (short-subunit alcohol dehydrogenase family)